MRQDMNDSISRQAAIKMFNEAKFDVGYCTEYEIGYNDGIDFAVSKLSVLPSVKPEKVTGIKLTLSKEQLREVVEKAKNEIIQELPSVQLDNQINLCDSCDYSYPDCPSKNDDVIFGNDIGNDNICACNKYKPFIQLERKTDVCENMYGEWKPDCSDVRGTTWVKWICSKCGYIRNAGWEYTTDGKKPKAKLCENCGAKMKRKPINIKNDLKF